MCLKLERVWYYHLTTAARGKWAQLLHFGSLGKTTGFLSDRIPY